MSIQYGELTTSELQHILDVTPPEMPHYQKAKDESARRIARQGLRMALIAIIVSAVAAAINIAKIMFVSR